MKRTPLSSLTSFPSDFQGSPEFGVSPEVLGGLAVAYSCKSSSQRARRCCKSWLGLLLFLAGAGVLGVQVTPAFMQLEQGLFRSHLILRCWQRTQARTRGVRPEPVGVDDIFQSASCRGDRHKRVDEYSGELSAGASVRVGPNETRGAITFFCALSLGARRGETKLGERREEK